MISIEPALTELRSKHLKGCLQFLDQQQLIQPSFNEQVGFDFQGLRKSYKDNPLHPESKFIAHYGRVWIYDIALSIYADLKTGRMSQAAYQVKRAMQLALQEEERGYQGLWHFSYNTVGDSFIDPRGPTGCNAWCLNAIYTYIVATGDTNALRWANKAVRKYLFPQQVMDASDPRCGLVRAGYYNPEDYDGRKGNMGYHVYEGDANRLYEHVILEHNTDIVGTYRLAFRATKRCALEDKDFLSQLIERHDLLMRGMHRVFWQKDHFVSAVDGEGRFYLGTDGLPSVAVDNNTWSAHVFLPYDMPLARAAIQYVQNRFLTRTPQALIEGLPEGASAQDLTGVFYFPASFSDPFVQVQAEYRPKMEQSFHLEAAFGFILFLAAAATAVSDPAQRLQMHEQACRLYEHAVTLQFLYGPLEAPYASVNVPAVSSTLSSVTTASTGLVTATILGGRSDGDFIGVTPPAEFAVAGQAPRIPQY